MPSHQRSQRGRSALVPLDADATDARPTTQGRVRPDASGSVLSSSGLPSINGSSSLVTISPWFKSSPRILDDGHDTRQHNQAPLPPDSPQKRGADSGPLVWVRVTKSGELAPSSERRDSEGELEGSYWWPACVRKFNCSFSWPKRLIVHRLPRDG